MTPEQQLEHDRDKAMDTAYVEYMKARRLREMLKGVIIAHHHLRDRTRDFGHEHGWTVSARALVDEKVAEAEAIMKELTDG